ncbi:MAG: acylphosphatase [Alphaproteobacteria bacterium]|nr:acylphosphatase [Alphaproteobacteria bacterium]
MNEEITTFRLRIKGEVQGVGYREWAIREASNRRLNGWVRNRGDGSVEMLISGPDAVVQDMLRATTQGPPAAQVTKIDIFREDELPEDGFKRQKTL